ncbi:ParA family protein [Kordiimonas sp. SCSIO 12603]|uniref:ParA family protein n=1 Tax=Kordiimonas sp. SCSIO 12603 TaxID=2829596 RepID=UPI002106B205|nr:ParA family protein [Kordiimonas sp. SCSIO 12603]UTW58959.1 ParA family protein [Kordiimonas sp. SCSIO 12603]
MRTIAITSQKGGSGKTTLTGHLAVAAEQEGFGPVALIDTDPQGSLSDWWNAREAETPLFAKASLSSLADDLQALKEAGVKLVFIDTPPAITRANQTVIAKSDLVVIPTRPSPHDLRAVGATIDLVEEAQKPMLFAINGATMRAKLTGEAAIALSQHGTVAPDILHNRQEFAASMIDGRTVIETNANGKSAQEVLGLWQYIEARLKKLPVKASFKTTNHHRMNGFGKKPASFGEQPAAL